jgi:hypothetical protein
VRRLTSSSLCASLFVLEALEALVLGSSLAMPRGVGLCFEERSRSCTALITPPAVSHTWSRRKAASNESKMWMLRLQTGLYREMRVVNLIANGAKVETRLSPETSRLAD